MEFSIRALSPETAKTGCVVLGVHADRELTPPARRVDQKSRGALRQALADLSGKLGATLLLRSLPNVAAERVLLVGLGPRKEFAEPAYREAVRAAANVLRELGAKEAALYLVDLQVGDRPVSWNVRPAVLGLREAFYRFDEMKSQKKNAPPSLERIILPLTATAVVTQTCAEAQATSDGAD